VDNKRVICTISLFTEKQKIFVLEGDNILDSSEYSQEDLVKAIPYTCYGNDIYDVKIFGPIAYTKRLAENVEKYEKLNYSQNKIKIEVNE
jgi:hypothetical protein